VATLYGVTLDQGIANPLQIDNPTNGSLHAPGKALGYTHALTE
jgi:hypothetical protein